MNKRIVVWLVLAGFLPGCYGLAGPNLHYPGTAGYQQARAQVFDPYPESELGPTVEGGRPLDYEKPIPEVDRARRLPKRPPGLNVPPIP